LLRISASRLPRRDLAFPHTMQQPLRQPCPAGLRLGGIDQFKETSRPKNIQINGVRMLLVQELRPGGAFSSPAVAKAVESPLVKRGHPPRRVPPLQYPIMDHSAEENSRKDSAKKKADWNRISQEDCRNH
jgi:hypothetical protein